MDKRRDYSKNERLTRVAFVVLFPKCISLTFPWLPTPYFLRLYLYLRLSLSLSSEMSSPSETGVFLNLKTNTRLPRSLLLFPLFKNFVGCRFRRHTTALRALPDPTGFFDSLPTQTPASSSTHVDALAQKCWVNPKKDEKKRTKSSCVYAWPSSSRSELIRSDATVRSGRTVCYGSADLF